MPRHFFAPFCKWLLGSAKTKATSAASICAFVALSTNIQAANGLDVCFFDSLTLSVQLLASPDCPAGQNGVLEAQPNGGTAPYHYYIDGLLMGNAAGPLTIDSLGVGVYSVLVVDALGDSAEAFIELDELGAPSLLESDFDLLDAACPGTKTGQIALSQPLPGVLYTLYDPVAGNDLGPLPVAQLSAGSYWAYATANGCVSVELLDVGQPPAWEVAVSVQPAACDGAHGGLFLNVGGAHGAYAYQWSNGAVAPSLADVQAGEYQVTILDAMGCSVTAQLQVGIDCQPLADTILVQVPPLVVTFVCADLSDATLTLPGPVDGFWYDTCDQAIQGVLMFDAATACFTYSPPTAALPSSDTACVVMCDSLGFCDTIVYLFITPSYALPMAGDDTIEVDLGGVGAANVLDNDVLNGGFLSLNILGQPSNGSAWVLPGMAVGYQPVADECGLDSLTYELCSVYGCDTAIVMVQIWCGAPKVFNAVSPNGDGLNDFLYIRGIEAFPVNELKIFNRWGNLVFEKKEYRNADGWAAMGEGGLLPDGVYFYVLNVENTPSMGPFSGYIQVHR